MRHSDRMSRDEFRGRKKMREAMNSKYGVCEVRSLAASIEVIITNPGTKDLAREAKRVKFNDS